MTVQGTTTITTASPAPVDQTKAKCEGNFPSVKALIPSYSQDPIWKTAVKIIACLTLLPVLVAGLLDLVIMGTNYFWGDVTVPTKTEGIDSAPKAEVAPVPKAEVATASAAPAAKAEVATATAALKPAESRIARFKTATKDTLSKVAGYVKQHPFVVATVVLSFATTVAVENFGILEKASSHFSKSNVTVDTDELEIL